MQNDGFKLSRFTIRLKLLSIISSIIFISLGIMTYFTSLYYNTDLEGRIQEENLNLVRVFGKQIESELKNINYTSKVLARSMRGSTPYDSKAFFKDNPFYLSISLGRIAKGKYIPKTTLYNDATISVAKLKRRTLQEANLRYFKSVQQALKKGKFTVFNASLDNVPILGITYPLSGQDVVLIYLEPSEMLVALQRGGLGDVFIVNTKGEVIAHSNSEVLVSHTNFLKNPIVVNMLEEGTNAGQSRYTYEGKDYMGTFQVIDVGNLGVIRTVDLEVVFAPVRRIQYINILIVAIVLTLALVFIFYFAKTITMPIQNLLDGVYKIEQGNYDINIVPAYYDEVGNLSYSFNKMVVGLGEREKMKDALGRFINKEIVKSVLRGDVKLGGEKKKAAIFFSDLRDFTALSERLEADEVVTFLNAYFTDMVNCINETHGIVDKYIGDAIMAHWGAIGEQSNITENAINAGLLMRKALIKFNEKFKGVFPIAKMGSGINTGDVISGQIGSEVRLEYTVIGDSVNLASRIEALNKPFGTDLLISEASYNEVKDIFKVASMPSIKVKGKIAPQKIYTVIGRMDDPNCPKSLDEVRDMIGIKYEKKTTNKDAETKEEKFEVLNHDK